MLDEIATAEILTMLEGPPSKENPEKSLGPVHRM
jgi:hypothetical protein